MLLYVSVVCSWFSAEWYSTVWMYQFVYLVEGDMGYFQFGTIMNKVAINIQIQIHVNISFHFSRVNTYVWDCWVIGKCMSHLPMTRSETAVFSIMLMPFCIPVSNGWEFKFKFYHVTSTWYRQCFYFSCSNMCGGFHLWFKKDFLFWNNFRLTEELQK